MKALIISGDFINLLQNNTGAEKAWRRLTKEDKMYPERLLREINDKIALKEHSR